MGLFGERFDRTEKHVFQHQNGTTGKQVADRIKGVQLINRKIIQQNLYRKYRVQGMGILDARKKAKGKAAKIMLKDILNKKHHHHHKR